MLPNPIPTACQGVRTATRGSIIMLGARNQYTTTSSAVPESHVVYASHLNQCNRSGIAGGAPAYFCGL